MPVSNIHNTKSG